MVIGTFAPVCVHAAGKLYLEPAVGTYPVGTTFTVEVRADSGETPVNSAEAEVAFNPAALEVLAIRTENSVIASWPSEPVFSNEKGTVTFSGWTSAYTKHKDARILEIDFRVRQPMVGNVRFVNAAMLSADAQSTNILTELVSGVYEGVIREVAPTPPIAAPPTPVAATDTSLASVEEEGQVGAPVRDLLAPIITDIPDTLRIDERLIVRGKTEPLATIYVWMSHNGEEPQRMTVQGTADGSFTYVSSEDLLEGSYVITAEARTADGLQTPLTQEYAIQVLDNRAQTAAVGGSFSGDYRILLASVVALVAAFFAVWFAARLRKQSSASV